MTTATLPNVDLQDLSRFFALADKLGISIAQLCKFIETVQQSGGLPALQRALSRGFIADALQAPAAVTFDRKQLRYFLCLCTPREIWREVNFGDREADVYAERLAQDSDCRRVDEDARQALSQLSVITEPVGRELLLASIDQLGFLSGAFYPTVCCRAEELGYELCPVETGPALLCMKDCGEKVPELLVASETLSSDGKSCVFSVNRVIPDMSQRWNDVLVLGLRDTAALLPPKTKLVFCSSNKRPPFTW